MTDNPAPRTRHRAKSNGRGYKVRQARGNHNQGFRSHNNSSQNELSESSEIKNSKSQPGLTLCKLHTEAPTEVSEKSTESCIICASDIIYQGLGPCNHPTCHVCSIRMRVLFKDKTCTVCRTPAPYIVITENRSKRFEEYTEEYFKKMDFLSIEEDLGLRFDSSKIREDTLWMLAYNCPEKDCDVACLAWPHLNDHTRRAHGKKICDICSKHRKIFPHEHKLFTDAELSNHMRKGDKTSETVNKSGFKGHPLCNFCGNRYYGDDELYKHLREKHERCFVCDRADPSKPPSYYVNYEALRLHFVQDHFICQVKDCLDQKYIAFISEFELKAHMLEVHGDSLSKDDLRDLKTVDLSDFSYRQPYLEVRREASSQRGQRSNRERNRGSGRGIGRDPNVESPPPISEQALRRDEQAFQRQLAVHSDQAVLARNFGRQVTLVTSNEVQTSQTRTKHSRTTESLQSNNMGVSSNSGMVELNRNLPPNQTRSFKFKTVNERASLLLQRDSSKICKFQSFLKEYQSGNMVTQRLINDFILLFTDTSSNALDALIKEIADLIENSQKAEELLKLWNNWRAINEDYPSLPASNKNSESSSILNWGARNGNIVSSGITSSASVRIIKQKKSTIQSGQSSVSQSRNLGTTNINSSTAGKNLGPGVNYISNAFPCLPTPPGSKDFKSISKTEKKSCSSSESPAATSRSNQESPSGSNSKALKSVSNERSNGIKKGKEAFPALPNVEKSRSQILGNGNRAIKKTIGTPTDNAWKVCRETNSSRASAIANDKKSAESGSTSSNKGKKQQSREKKQVLMGWG